MTLTRTTRSVAKPAPAKKRSAKKRAARAARPRSFNLSLLRRVRARILAHPEKYDQSTFCGTSYCIAGHAIMQAGTPDQQKRFRKLITYQNSGGFKGSNQMPDPGAEAGKLLRLTPEQQNLLFGGGFPAEILDAIPYSDEVSISAKAKFQAKRGAARIDLFISSGGKK